MIVLYDNIAIIVENVIINWSTIMENILSRDQRTTSHRVLDHAAQSYALNLTSTLPPKCQDDVVASNRSIEATISTINCAEKCLPCDLYHTTASYDNRIELIHSAPTSILRFVPTWLCKLNLHQLC